MPVVAAIVLNWNDAEATIDACISVLQAFSACADRVTQATLWVVDNGSSTEDSSRLQKWCLTQNSRIVTFLANRTNLGVAGGMNVGITAASDVRPEFYLLLNNDVVLNSQAISALIDHSQTHEHIVITGLSLLDAKTGLLQSAGGYRYYPWLAYNRPLLAGKPLDKALNYASRDPDYASGAAMWVDGKFLRRVGGIPDNHFLYFEELELNQHFEPDEKTGWCREAVATHEGGGSLKTSKLQEFGTYHAALSAFTYTWQYHPWFLPTVVIARMGGIILRALQRGQPGLVWAVFKALSAFIKNSDS